MPVGPDFVPWMQEQVGQWADRYGTNERRAFPAWGIHYLFEVEEDDAFNQTDTLTQGDAGLDGWFYDRDAGVFHLLQAKYLDDPISGQVQPGDLDPLLRAALLLRDAQAIEEGPHREKLAAIALSLQQARLDDANVSLDFLILGNVAESAKESLQQAAAQLGTGYSATFYDTERLYVEKLAEDPIADLAGEYVDFRVSGNDAVFERSESSLNGVMKVAVAALDGRSLADAVDAKGPRLFHSNVRYYLRRANRVNKAMLATLDDASRRGAFWLYNNGITIVADSVDTQIQNGVTYLRVSNPQVVNGAQTSSVLRDRRAHLQAGDVSVQARIIAVTGDEAGREALEQISEYTNSQSPVRAGDLRSNDERHRKLQTSFGMLTPPVFYERRRGEWDSLTPADRARYLLRVTKEDVGQRFLAYKGMPAEAIAKKESIFGELESEAFDTTVSAQVYMLANMLYGQADNLLKQSNEASMLALVPGFATPIGSEPDAPTQLEVLRRVRKLAGAHATALARVVLETRYSNIAEQRAKALRERLADSQDATSTFIWRQVFRAIRQWLSAQPDKAALKAQLQRPETLPQIKATLLDVLSDADSSTLAAI